MFEEFGGEACKRSEQQGFFAVNIARVQMGNGHRRRAHFGFAIHFGMVLGNQFFVAAHEKQAAHGEASDVLAFGNACFLQQVQAAAARADEYEIGGVLLQYAVFQAGDRPFLVGGAVDGGYFGVVMKLGLLLGKVGEKLAGELAEVYVCAVVYAGGGDGLAAGAVVHHQRQPLAQRGFVFAVLHIGKQGMLHQRSMAGAQELDVALAGYKADVRQAADEVFRLPDTALLCPMRPQLQRLAKFFVDGDGAVDADAAIGGLRGVVEFAQRGVPRARVVAFLRAFQCRRAQPFKHGDAFFGRKLFEQRAERGAHDAGAD